MRNKSESLSSVFITGAAGRVASVLASLWAEKFVLTGTDRCPPHTSVLWNNWLEADLEDAITDVAAQAARHDFVVHLASGASEGWRGLRNVEIDSTRTILNTCAERGHTRRVILASSNHAVGGLEVDWLEDHRDATPAPFTEPVRPDSEYGAAKVFVEAYGRYAAERLGINVSCLRIGTLRRTDNFEKYVVAPEFAYLGPRNRVQLRLKNTWLSHSDLDRIMTEELLAHEAFRLRYAFSAQGSWIWPTETLVWERH